MNRSRGILIRAALTAALCLLPQAAAWASEIGYQVTVDTTAISGASGFLDFQFNPGGADSQPATVLIENFSSDGALGTEFPPIGSVSGSLPGVVEIDNTSSPLNDYFQGFTFGNGLQFFLVFSGPAVSSPNGTSTSASEFGFSMFDSSGINPLLTSNPFGFAATVDINLDGSATPISYDPGVVQLAAAPEPATCLLGIPVLALAFWRRRK